MYFFFDIYIRFSVKITFFRITKYFTVPIKTVTFVVHLCIVNIFLSDKQIIFLYKPKQYETQYPKIDFDNGFM